MNEERDYFYNDSDVPDFVERYEEMLSKSTRYYFDVDEFEEIIDHYLSLGKVSSSYLAVQHALKQHPGSTSIQIKKAVLLNERSQPKEALRLLNAIQKIELNNPEVYYTKGVSFALLGKAEEAVEQFNMAVDLTLEGKEDLLFNISVALDQQSFHEKALEFLLKAHEIEPDNLPYIFDIAYSYEVNGQPLKALEFYNKYLDIDPFAENVWFNLGVIYNQLEEYDKAINAYDYALAIDSEYSTALFNKANSFANSGKLREAIDTYISIPDMEDNSDQIYCYIGECYEKLLEFDHALIYYEKTIEFNPLFADAWLGKAMVMFAGKNFLESLKYVEKAIQLSPDNPDYHFSKGNVLIKLELFREAIKSYSTAIEFDGEDHESWINMSEAWILLGDYDRAIELLEEEALLVNLDNPQILYRLAAYAFMTKQDSKGVGFLNKALSIDGTLLGDFELYYPDYINNKAILKKVTAFKKKQENQ